MNEREEQVIRNHLRQARSTFASLVNEDYPRVDSIHCRALAAIAHIDKVGDELDAMRRREEERREAWRQEMHSQAEEMFI